MMDLQSSFVVGDPGGDTPSAIIEGAKSLTKDRQQLRPDLLCTQDQYRRQAT
jgi:hypothetical protein